MKFGIKSANLEVIHTNIERAKHLGVSAIEIDTGILSAIVAIARDAIGKVEAPVEDAFSTVKTLTEMTATIEAVVQKLNGYEAAVSALALSDMRQDKRMNAFSAELGNTVTASAFNAFNASITTRLDAHHEALNAIGNVSDMPETVASLTSRVASLNEQNADLMRRIAQLETGTASKDFDTRMAHLEEAVAILNTEAALKDAPAEAFA
jgi:hypothetical protein